jgi:hypothetical protein
MESEIKINDMNIESRLKFSNNFITESKNCNFRKSVIQVPKGTVELGISFYSNVLFVMINSNGKLGNIWVGESEQESETLEENFSDIKCILGNRKDEISQFFSDAIINYIFNEIRNSKIETKYDNIKKIMLSLALKYETLFDCDVNSFNQDDLLYSKEFKIFVAEVKKNFTELIF